MAAAAAPASAAIVSSQQRAPVAAAAATVPVAAVHQAALAHPELKLKPSTRVLEAVAKRVDKFPDGKVTVAYTTLSAMVQRAADEGARGGGGGGKALQ